jgi:hypothetical protein
LLVTLGGRTTEQTTARTNYGDSEPKSAQNDDEEFMPIILETGHEQHIEEPLRVCSEVPPDAWGEQSLTESGILKTMPPIVGGQTT